MAPVSAIDAGHAIIVKMKALGHAVRNCPGHLACHCIEGPVKIRLMVPDIANAMRKVMITCESKTFFLFIREFLVQDGDAIGDSAADPYVEGVGAMGSHCQSDYISRI